MYRSLNSHIRHCETKLTGTLWQLVVVETKLPEGEARELIDLGAVYLEKRREKDPDRLVKEGTYLRIHLYPRRYPVASIDWMATLFAETADFIIINKPPGIPLISTVDNVKENVLAKVAETLGRKLYVCHRIDRGTRGLAVFGLTKKFQIYFNRLLSDRKVLKKYRAITRNSVPVGRHLHYLDPKQHAPSPLSIAAVEHWVPCELEVENTHSVSNAFWEHTIRLITGRTHQIRRQLSFLGAPLLGDKMYGGEEVAGFSQDSFALQAYELSFEERFFRLNQGLIPSFLSS